MARFVVNPYFENANSSAEIVNDEWLLEKADKLAKVIINREIGDKEISEAGPHTGLSGIALALFKGIDLPAHDTIATASAYLKQCMKFNLRSEEKETSDLTGQLGTLAVLLEDPLSNRNDVEKHMEAIGHVLAQPSHKFNNVVMGRAGFLAAVLWIRQRVDPDLISTEVVSDVIASILNAGKSYAIDNHSPCPLMFEHNGEELIGAAYGLSGILQMLLSFPDLLSTDAMCSIKESADWILSTQDSTGNFPSSTKHIGRIREDSLVHWSEGAPGVVYLWLLMWKHFGDMKYEEAAVRCGDLIWGHGILRNGPGLCAGISGNGYALLALWRATRNSMWLSRARCFAHAMMDERVIKQQRTSDAPFSLFDGWSGALCYLLDLLEINVKDAQFPLFPLPF